MTETPADPQPVEPTWGAAPEEPRRWNWRKTAVAAAVAVGIAAAGGAAVWAASTAAGEHDGRGGGPMIRMAGPMGDVAALHGETVMKNDDGEYYTQLTQTGEILEITDDAVTARSEDGFTRTYVITGDTIVQSAEVGDKAMIVAVLEGDTATAESVVDVAEMKPPGGVHRGGGPAGPDAPDGP
ncbi:hypothetical protein [Actinokineospora fastidiosa]|uniref:DUF5666 domain-containing protein n=1 Tax=Actinokineospora fastidiosa TaxID=1816 RepID=A0A918GGW6_9PSEU|nr:hypothetical protein [Actinokineospora fastidiosa]GGS31741.1 hypothetical protein GCM10010171_27060 [Actinokineospora fastidiosa]